jgi:K(+)-stimulated pyrophosphate-energized sodium pump
MYGIATATMGMNLVTGMIIAMDAFGPIVDNAGGIAEMSGLGPKVREVTDALDSVGNTTKAVCKGFAISDAAFETTALFLVYMYHAKIESISLTEPSVIVGMFVGGALAYVFSSFCLKAVGTTAFRMIEEIRRQFREIRGLKEGEAKPDYVRCVDISTRAALKNMLAPSILAIAVPLIIGFTLGPEAVGGMLLGNIICALVTAIMMAHSGTAWDNAKKYIEAGNLGGKGTPTHAAAVVGDTIGDPFKDTAGPSLDVMMTILSTISILFAELFTYALFV